MLLFIRLGLTVVAVTATVVFSLIHKRNREQRHSYNPMTKEPDLTCRPDDGCSLCLKKMDALTGRLNIALNCGHKFHKNCIAAVFTAEVTKNITCPICREHVSKDVITELNL